YQEQRSRHHQRVRIRRAHRAPGRARRDRGRRSVVVQPGREFCGWPCLGGRWGDIGLMPEERTMKKSPLITLNNGTAMPALGLGVLDRPTRQLTAGAVEAAIAAGYRLIDTAVSYLNEQEVGEGLRRSGIDRSEVFVTTKLWLSQYGYDGAL